jgi:alanine racemase
MQSAIPTDLAGAVLTIDLRAIQANWKILAAAAGTARCGVAIKGNAYGLGMIPVGRALWSAGCRHYFVARPMEGADLRAILPEAEIYVLDGLFPGQAEFYARHRLRPALTALDEAREWAQFGRHYGHKLPCALHVDTGINRLGFSPEEFRALLDDAFLLQGLNFTLLMSHLACGDDPAHPMNRLQRDRFDALRAALPGVPASLANSPGIYLGPGFTDDLVRAGIAIYGGNPTPGKPNPMQPVVTLSGTVMQVRDVAAGDTVGYSATWQATRPATVAVLGAGYKDGIPRALSSRQPDGPAQVFIHGRRCPIIGRVSMDMMGIDVTDLPRGTVKRGDHAEIFGSNIAIDEAAAWAGTISYELLTRLGSRYAMIYDGDESDHD